MTWIYLSPHLDDAALSCGGLLWQQAQQGTPVEVWTVCAGDPPERLYSEFVEELHARWGGAAQAMERRRQEDIEACQKLGVAYRHLDYPDCIYRGHPASGEDLYPDREAIFGNLSPADGLLAEALADELRRRLPQYAVLVCPLAIGNHVDHQLVRRVASMVGWQSAWYYADYPYAHRAAAELAALKESGWQSRVFPISEAGMEAWASGVAAYTSQISSFWPDLEAMHADLEAFAQVYGGVALWKPPEAA
jgi:LmbE family N-acetylglucosaminyl deacetylase